MTAVGVMKRGPDIDVDRIAADARIGARRVPLLALHGDDDEIVTPKNAIALVRQYLRFNGHPAVDLGAVSDGVAPPADAESHETGVNGHAVITRDWRVDGKLLVRLVTIARLGHAWSGGDGRFPYNDPRAPDATALIAAFARDALA